jgi:DNA-binding IclR family transcriptional regulator
MSQDECFIALKKLGKPSLNKELAEATGICPTTTAYYTKMLFKKGCVKRTGTKRGYLYSLNNRK